MDHHIALKFSWIIASAIGLIRFRISRIKHPVIANSVNIYYNCILVSKIVFLVFSFTLLPEIYCRFKRNFNFDSPIKIILYQLFPFFTTFNYHSISLFICVYSRVYLKTFERVIKLPLKEKGIWVKTFKNVFYLCGFIILLSLLIFVFNSYIDFVFILFHGNDLFYTSYLLADFYSFSQMYVIRLVFWANMTELSIVMKRVRKRNNKFLKQKYESICLENCIAENSHPEINHLKISLIGFCELLE